MINVDSCAKYLKELLNEIHYSQIDNFHSATKLIRESINNKGNIYFFGQGHSVWVGLDQVGNYNLPIKVIEEISDNPKEVLDNCNISTNDIFIIVSNSGINTFVVELAILIKKLGNKLIVINSYKHTMQCHSRHPSKTKLYEYGDIVIDNCCVYGDAAIKDDGVKVGSFSSIANNYIMHTILSKIKS